MLTSLDFWQQHNINRLPDVITRLTTDTDVQIMECRWKSHKDTDFCILLIRFDDNEEWKISNMRRAA